jgi:hypothetical protein
MTMRHLSLTNDLMERRFPARRLFLTGMLLIACSACDQDSAETSNSITLPVDQPVVSEPSASEAPSTDSNEEETVTTEDTEGKVLRHAVFFSFKEESSEEDVAGVVGAFRELPSKISEIIDFEWGTNNSPEGLNDGFTHCFLLTFANKAGRAAYLPHAAHKAFGDVLRPHMDKVFVIDYWGRPSETAIETPLRHAVFFRFKEDVAADDIAAVEEGFAALPGKIDTIKAFEWGRNNSPEKHDAGFTHCFMVTFDSDEGRAAYLPHAEHLAFVEVLKPVLDAPRVLDFVAQK